MSADASRRASRITALFTFALGLFYASGHRWSEGQKALQTEMTNQPGTVLIAFASQTGAARSKAQDAVLALEHSGVLAEALPVGTLTPDRLAAATRMLFIVSTYGNGEPPDMARGFTSRIMRGDPMDLSHLRYGLLALGNRDYPDFCGYGRKVEGWLTRSGATPIFPFIAMDRRDTAAEEAWQAVLRDPGAIAAN